MACTLVVFLTLFLMWSVTLNFCSKVILRYLALCDQRIVRPLILISRTFCVFLWINITATDLDSFISSFNLMHRSKAMFICLYSWCEVMFRFLFLDMNIVILAKSEFWDLKWTGISFL